MANGSLFTYFETETGPFNHLYLELKSEIAATATERSSADPELRVGRIGRNGRCRSLRRERVDSKASRRVASFRRYRDPANASRLALYIQQLISGTLCTVNYWVASSKIVWGAKSVPRPLP